MSDAAAPGPGDGGSPPPWTGAALGALLGDADVQAFASATWSRAAFLRSAAHGPDLTGLLSLSDADELLSTRALRTPFVRIAKDGVVQPESSYTRGAGTGAGVRDQVDADAVARLLSDGCTVVLQGLHRAWPPVVELATQLTRDLGHPVQVNAYLTPPTAQGFAAHYDTHDVFVVQTAGDKRWQVHRPVVESPSPREEWTAHRAEVEAAAGGTPVLDHVLRPGDVLYLPRGWIHAAQAQDAMSLHLTIGVHPYTRRHLADAVVAQALQGLDLEESLPLGVDVGDAHELEPYLADVRDRLAAAVRTVPAAQVATRMERRRADDTRPAPLRPVEQAQAAARAGHDDTVAVRVRPGSVARVEEDVEGVALVVDGRRFELEPEHAAAVKALLAGEVLEAGQVVGLDAAAGRVLVRRLLQHGAVVPVSRP